MSELLLIDDDQELCELLTSWLSLGGGSQGTVKLG